MPSRETVQAFIAHVAEGRKLDKAKVGPASATMAYWTLWSSKESSPEAIVDGVAGRIFMRSDVSHLLLPKGFARSRGRWS